MQFFEQKLKDPKFIEERVARFRRLVKEALPGGENALTSSTPLGMLERMTKGRKE